MTEGVLVDGDVRLVFGVIGGLGEGRCRRWAFSGYFAKNGAIGGGSV